jgi:hypothetical protein
MPTVEVRDRLRIAHAHIAAGLHRAAVVHEEAATFWDAVHDHDAAAEHRRLIERCLEQAAEHEALATEYEKPSTRTA